jgi:MFS family permease
MSADAKAEPSLSAAEEWRRHWPLVLSASIGASIVSIAITTIGAFMLPLERAFGWTRAEISGGLLLYAAAGVICSPLMGVLVDRWGPRRLGIGGLVASGAAFALFGTVTGSWLHWMALWFIYTLAAQAPRPLVWTAAVSSEFDAGRAMALAIVMVGSGAGGIAAPIVATQLIVAYGWRTAFVVMGLAWGWLAALFCYFFFFGRSDRQRLARAGAETKAEAPLTGIAASEAFLSPAFIKLCVATVILNTLQVGLLVHTIPILVWDGMTRVDAAWVVGWATAGGVIGQFLAGAALSKIPGNRFGAFIFALPIGYCLLMLGRSDSVWERIPVVLLNSIATGVTTNILTYLVTRYFGLRAYGALFGVVASMMAIGVGLGPFLGGFAFDTFKSYRVVLLAGIPMSVTASLLILSLGRYPATTIDERS